jgi:hypothetical protein
MTERVRMTLGLALLSVAVLIAAGVASARTPTTSAAISTKAGSVVSITSGTGTLFTIKVTSPSKACVKGRKVELDREGVEVGSGTTNASGVANLPGSYQAGFFTSTVKENAHCKGAKSKRKHF